MLELLNRLKASVLGTHADQALTPEEREAIFTRTNVPEPLRRYVEKMALHAYKITDEEVAALVQATSEEKVYEATVTAAAGAAWVRLEAGLRALGEK